MESVEKNENCRNIEKKKKKKKKKKSKVPVEQDISSNGILVSEEKEGYCSVSDMLPRKVGEKAVFKDLEVTLTEGAQSSGISIPVTEKKKKEPEAADYSAAIASFKKDTKNEPDEQPNLTNIVKLGSKYGQSPDVSITLYNENQAGEIPASENNPANVDQKQQSSSGAVNEGGVLPKKKKKKKKKKPQKVKNLEIPEAVVDVSEDPVNNPPTYVKLPGSGDNCVLLVSHESFGGNGTAGNQQAASDISKVSEQLDKPRNVKILAKPSSVSIMPTLSMTQNYDASNNQQQLSKTELILTSVKSPCEVPSSNLCADLPSLPAMNTSSSCIKDNNTVPHATETRLSEKVVINDSNEPSSPDSQFYDANKTLEMVKGCSGAGPSVTEESNLSKTVLGQKHSPPISSGSETQGPTKAQLRAQRRELQEKQRAAKLANKNEKIVNHTAVREKGNNKVAVSVTKKEKPEISNEKPPVSTTSVVVKQSHKEKLLKSGHDKEKSHEIRLFSHLPRAKPLDQLLSQRQVDGVVIHPAMITIGAQYAQGIICGSNARCIALLSAFKEVFKDYITPPNTELPRDLRAKLLAYVKFLSSCRPLSVGMLNAVKFVLHQIYLLTPDKTDEQAKQGLLEQVANFVREEIFLAKDAICTFAAGKIVDGDVILTYGSSSLVKEVLCSAYKEKKFSVIVVDSRPKMEGREMLRNLLKIGIPCSYMLINSISYIMPEVSKVILGAHALQANGYVMSRVGCSQIALVASAYNVPVLVCCETYKFCERVYTDSFVYNELADPHSLVKTNYAHHNHLENWTDIPKLQVLNLMYDLTSPDLVDMVITEKGMLPCTSVPVVLRVRHVDYQEQ